MNKPTTLTHAITDGELHHVVIVAGEPVQTHTSLKAAMCALALAIALTGCQTMERYPRTSAFLAASLMASAALSLESRGHGPIDEPRMSVPLVDCSKDPGSCK